MKKEKTILFQNDIGCLIELDTILYIPKFRRWHNVEILDNMCEVNNVLIKYKIELQLHLINSSNFVIWFTLTLAKPHSLVGSMCQRFFQLQWYVRDPSRSLFPTHWSQSRLWGKDHKKHPMTIDRPSQVCKYSFSVQNAGQRPFWPFNSYLAPMVNSIPSVRIQAVGHWFWGEGGHLWLLFLRLQFPLLPGQWLTSLIL